MVDSQIDIDSLLREIAKSSKYQILFQLLKEAGLRLFQNPHDLTNMQVLFLHYLSFYSSLNMDISLKEVDEIVKTDFIFEDAYMFYKSKHLLDRSHPNNHSEPPKGINTGNRTIIRKRKRKK